MLSGELCSRACIANRIPVSNLEAGRSQGQSARTCWESLDQQIINKSIDQWRDRLKAVVRVNGGHIEQLL